MAGVLVSPEAWAAYQRHRDEVAGILDSRFYPLDWLDAQIEAGAIGIMHNDTAIIAVEVRHYPGGARELHGMFAAGEMDGIKELVELACRAGAQAGCLVAAIESRPGWQRVFKDLGFRTDRVRIIKDLGDGS